MVKSPRRSISWILRATWGWLLLAILVEAHFEIPLSSRNFLYYLNLDIPFTPVTSDMAYFRGGQEASTRYATPTELHVVLKNGQREQVDLLRQDFHLVKLPLLLFLEALDEEAPHRLHLSALCAELGRKRGDLSEIVLNGKKFSCP
jgi:hypothetical protein